MNKKQEKDYKPGYYGKKRLSPGEWADASVKKWMQEQAERKHAGKKANDFPTICFSRQIGVGALEIADILSKILHYRVIDRELLEHMAKDANLAEKVIEHFDERYPGKMSELFLMLISEKTFIKSDYERQLVKTVTALANSEPTIFVGRGTHMILPRNRVLSVRFISSREYRIGRLAAVLKIGKSEAQRRLKICDVEQHEFFKSVYQKKETSPEEFDLVINRDHIKEGFQAAQIVACAFKQKFGLENQES